jgi:hypothetical protein
MLAGYNNHDVISGLLGRGQLETVLKHFIEPGPIDRSIRRL